LWNRTQATSFETVEVREFDVLPADLSWNDGIYAYLLRSIGLPGVPDDGAARSPSSGRR
jgi:8-oxo-dGTP diphosphatase